MSATRASKSRGLLLALLALFAGAALYAGTTSHGFVYDDINVVQKNPLARDPGAIGEIFSSHYWANVTEHGNLYRPVTIYSFALNHALTGPGPAGHHLTNALLHGLVAGLVVLLALAMRLASGPALCSGLLFAVHPVHVEAVAPLVGRSELLAALFGLGAWLIHLRGSDPGQERNKLRTILHASAAAALMGLALLSKENAFVIPVLIWIGDRVMRKEASPGTSGRLSLFMMSGVALLILGLRAWIIPGVGEEAALGAVFADVGSTQRILTSIGVLGRYLWLMIYPMNLSADYSYHQIPLISSPGSLLFLASAAIHGGLTAAAFVLAKKSRISGLALWIYLGALFPVSNILFSIGTVMGERLLYLPSVGLCLLAPALYQDNFNQRISTTVRRLLTVAIVVIVGLYGARLLSRSADWKDQHTLFRKTVQTSPLSAKAHYNLGVSEDELGNLKAAVESYSRAVAIKPDMVEAIRNLGLAQLRSGHPAPAAASLTEAARLDPDIPDLFSDLGIALYQTGRNSGAEAAFREEIRRRPEGAQAWFNLGTLLLETGRAGEALRPLGKARSLDDTDPDMAAQHAGALAIQDQHLEALAAYRAALALNPSMTEIIIPMARTAMRAGKPEEARQALRLAMAAGLTLPEDLRQRLP
jgi:tetratricopeptide (TPR) repeat protein